MRLALIGLGAIGAVRVRAIAASPAVELIAVHDLDPDRARSVVPHVKFYTRLDQLLADPDVDAVVISTPPQFHEPSAVAALDAGKHVLVEKPMAPTLEGCRRMLEAANRNQRALAVGFNHRYFPAVKLVRDAVQSGAVGTLTHVRGYAGHTGLSEFKAPWMYSGAVMGGGTLFDNGIHVLDLVRHILGDFCEVVGQCSSKVWNLPDAEDNAMSLFRGADGALGSLQASWSEWKGYRFHIEAYGDRGMARAYYAPMMATLITLDKPGGRRRIHRRFFPVNIFRERLWGWQSTTIQTFVEELADFKALASGAAGSGRLATGWDGLRAVEAAHAIYQSNITGHAVSLSSPPHDLVSSC